MPRGSFSGPRLGNLVWDPTALFPGRSDTGDEAAAATHRHATAHTRDTAQRDGRGCVARAGEQQTAGPADRPTKATHLLHKQ
jgi:hypothetical protein